MSEQQSQPATSTAIGDKWGDPITPARAATLRELADRQRAWVESAPEGQSDVEQSVFQVELTGAEVFWLAAYALAGPEGDMAAAQERLGTADERDEDIDLSALHLEGAFLIQAHLEGAHLGRTHLERANLLKAHLEGANLSGAHLEGKTYVPGDADLARIRQSVHDFPATLPPADIHLAFFDTVTTLDGISRGNAKGGAIKVADVRWGGANLAVVDWTLFTDRKAVLRDEQAAREFKPESFTETEEQRKRPRWERAEACAKHSAEQAQKQLQLSQTAVRANRQLATVLRDQGMNEEADYFAYRAQVLQRRMLQLQGKRGRAVGSWLLDVVSGYGYRPVRSLATYVFVVFGFAAAYYLLRANVTPALNAMDSLVFSVTRSTGGASRRAKSSRCTTR